MNIRTRLTLIFFALVIFIVSAISISIYYFSSNYREDDFARRLKNRAINTAKVLLEFEQIDAELLKKMEGENPANLPDQFVRIYNQDFSELYSSDIGGIFPSEPSRLSKIIKEQQVRFEEDNFELIGFLYQEKSGTYIIVAGANDVYGRDALRNLRHIIIVTFCISVILVSIVGHIYSGRVLKPISAIVREVENITEESLDKRLNEGNKKDELGKLAQTFNRMLSRLQSAFVSQKNFIANASHEMKTPFTVMAGEIEVTLLHPREKEYYIRILQSVLDGIRRFNKLSTQLLLLAQTSSDAPQRRFNILRIDDILWEAKHDLERLHPEYHIEIIFDMNINHDILQIYGDEQLLKVLIMNLMDNGCKYSDDNKVVISIGKAEKNFVVMDFVNSGAGIEPQEIEKIFDPFYRGRNSNKKGFGIGLSLASKILAVHQGKINVESTPEISTRFTILLPIEFRKDV